MERRLVVDTNVLVNHALGPPPVLRERIDRVLASGRLLFSPATLDELVEVLSRPIFDRHLPRLRRLALAGRLSAGGLLVDPGEPVSRCRDPDDDRFLEVARDGRAACIVTGDRDLLVLRCFEGIPILRPADYLKRFEPRPAPFRRPFAGPLDKRPGLARMEHEHSADIRERSPQS